MIKVIHAKKNNSLVLTSDEHILLRQYQLSDIDDWILWNTVETEWLLWDAPWETESCKNPFDCEEYRQEQIQNLKKKKTALKFHSRLQICVNNAEQTHIGSVNCYCLDNNFEYTNNSDKYAVGISIPDLSERRKGYGTRALGLYIRYLLNSGCEKIYTQTWSGNKRMMGLAEKLGFVECNRNVNAHFVRGNQYHDLTYQLNNPYFHNHF